MDDDRLLIVLTLDELKLLAELAVELLRLLAVLLLRLLAVLLLRLLALLSVLMLLSVLVEESVDELLLSQSV